MRSSSAQGPSGTGFFLFPTARPSSTGERGTLRAKHVSRVPDSAWPLPLRALLATGTLVFSTSCGRGLRGTVPVPLFGRELVPIRSMNSGPELWRSTHSIGPAWFNVFFAAAWPRNMGS